MVFLSHGVIYYRFANGARRQFSAAYNHEHQTFGAKAGHGYCCPWELGASLAASFKSGVIEMLFSPDEYNVHMPMDIELYRSREHLEALEILSICRRMAPVPVEEICGQNPEPL